MGRADHPRKGEAGRGPPGKDGWGQAEADVASPNGGTTTLIHEAASIFTLLVIVALSVVLDFAWRRRPHTRTPSHPVPGTESLR